MVTNPALAQMQTKLQPVLQLEYCADVILSASVFNVMLRPCFGTTNNPSVKVLFCCFSHLPGPMLLDYVVKCLVGCFLDQGAMDNDLNSQITGGK